MWCDARERDQALVEQLRQQQLELAKAPVVEAPATIPRVAAEVTTRPAVENAVLAPSPSEGATPLVTQGEGKGGEAPLGAETEGAEVELADTGTRTRTDEVAADGQPATLSVQDATQDSEESRKRRESMRSNAEQVR